MPYTPEEEIKQVDLLFAFLDASYNDHYQYYQDFERGLASMHQSCYAAERQPQCAPWERWLNHEIAPAAVVFVVPHMSTTMAEILPSKLALAKLILDDFQRHYCNVPAVVLVCLNKVYADLEMKLAAIDEFRSQIDAPVVIITWSHSVAARYGLHFVPFAVDANQFHLPNATPFNSRHYDVFFSGDTNPTKYPMRPSLLDALNRSSHLSLDAPETFLPTDDYLRALAETRMVLTTPGFPSTPDRPWFDIVGTRAYEVLATGSTLLLCQRSDAYAQLGIIENKTAVMFSTESEALLVAQRFARDYKASMRVVRNARRLALRQHTWAARAATVSRITINAIPDMADRCVPKVEANVTSNDTRASLSDSVLSYK